MHTQRDQEAPHEESWTESSPLLRPMKQATSAALCTCGEIVILAVGWGILDYWNRTLSSDLFNIGDVREIKVDNRAPDVQVELVAPFHKFCYPLTLAFVQFTFMSLFFLGTYCVLSRQSPAQALFGQQIFSDKRWPMLVGSHVASTFWLQSLMMPHSVMSLGLFAASRAVEIPAAAALRQPVLSNRFGRKTLQTTSLAFGAAFMMYFAYAQLAGCVCIFSGNGIALSGLAFWCVYALILTMPAVNAVYQEAMMTQPGQDMVAGMHPMLLLTLMNIFACISFAPILLLSHKLGWENVTAGFRMIFSKQEVFLTVIWLCVQMSLTSIVCSMLIHIADSFWAIALRALRVVFWGIALLGSYYFSQNAMSIAIVCPKSSFWSFVICCGAALAASAIYTDRKAADNFPTTEKESKIESQAVNGAALPEKGP